MTFKNFFPKEIKLNFMHKSCFMDKIIFKILYKFFLGYEYKGLYEILMNFVFRLGAHPKISHYVYAIIQNYEKLDIQDISCPKHFR